jgi:hypothetical protein
LGNVKVKTVCRCREYIFLNRSFDAITTNNFLTNSVHSTCSNKLAFSYLIDLLVQSNSHERNNQMHILLITINCFIPYIVMQVNGYRNSKAWFLISFLSETDSSVRHALCVHTRMNRWWKQRSGNPQRSSSPEDSMTEIYFSSIERSVLNGRGETCRLHQETRQQRKLGHQNADSPILCLQAASLRL